MTVRKVNAKKERASVFLRNLRPANKTYLKKLARDANTSMGTVVDKMLTETRKTTKSDPTTK